MTISLDLVAKGKTKEREAKALPYNGDVLTGVSPEYTLCVRVCGRERAEVPTLCGSNLGVWVWARLSVPKISICEAASRPLRAAVCAGLRRKGGRGVEPRSYFYWATTTLALRIPPTLALRIPSYCIFAWSISSIDNTNTSAARGRETVRSYNRSIAPARRERGTGISCCG